MIEDLIYGYDRKKVEIKFESFVAEIDGQNFIATKGNPECVLNNLSLEHLLGLQHHLTEIVLKKMSVSRMRKLQ